MMAYRIKPQPLQNDIELNEEIVKRLKSEGSLQFDRENITTAYALNKRQLMVYCIKQPPL